MGLEIQVYVLSTDWLQRKGDEFRFWVPRGLTEVNVSSFLQGTPCPDFHPERKKCVDKAAQTEEIIPLNGRSGLITKGYESWTE